jgi:hypothetical protein
MRADREAEPKEGKDGWRRSAWGRVGGFGEVAGVRR